MKVPRLLVILLGICLVLISSGCGKNQSLVKAASVKSHSIDGDAYGELTAVLDTGGVSLPSIQLPIFDPRNPAITYGSVALRPQLGTYTDLVVDINLSEVANVPGGGATLPNGAMLPVGGLDGTRILALPVGNTGVKVYVALELGIGGSTPNAVAMFGVAIPFKQLNEVGSYIGGASLFTQFSFGGGVQGIAGVFTGAKPGQTGIALFVNASALLNKPAPAAPAELASSGLAVARSALTTSGYQRPTVKISRRALSFASVRPSAYKEDAINTRLYRLHKKKARLTVQ